MLPGLFLLRRIEELNRLLRRYAEQPRMDD